MLREMGGGAAPSLLVSGDTKEGLRNPRDFSSRFKKIQFVKTFKIYDPQSSMIVCLR